MIVLSFCCRLATESLVLYATVLFSPSYIVAGGRSIALHGTVVLLIRFIVAQQPAAWDLSLTLHGTIVLSIRFDVAQLGIVS